MARSFAVASSQWLFKPSALLSAYPTSFAAWINKTNNAASHGIMHIGPTSGTNIGPDLYTDSSGHLIGDIGGAAGATTTATITAGTWTHVAGVFLSTSSRSVYIGGANKITSTLSRAFGAATRTYLGNLFQNANFPMNGAIAFAGFWNVALSDADIASLAAGAHPILVQPAALVACVNMTGGNSPEPDLTSATGWTLNGTPTEVANPRIYGP